MLKWLALLAIRYYRSHVSPKRPPRCWMKPTCSTYALQAVENWGFYWGVQLAADRLNRCNKEQREVFYSSVEGDYPAVRCCDPVPVRLSAVNRLWGQPQTTHLKGVK